MAPPRRKKATDGPVAADVILQGAGKPLQAGDPIPATYVDHLGAEHDQDFDRLEALGLVVGADPVELVADEPVVETTSPDDPTVEVGEGVDPVEPVEGAGSDGEIA